MAARFDLSVQHPLDDGGKGTGIPRRLQAVDFIDQPFWILKGLTGSTTAARAPLHCGFQGRGGKWFSVTRLGNTKRSC